jgi:hypothetical protein|tara:strand:+ start:49 stop:1098 length:1050 start_codon:yes stop_codon:yes gene_type:complete
MKDLYLDNFYKLDLYGKSSKKPYNRGKSFGYQVLGFGSGVATAAALPTQKGIFPFGSTFVVATDTFTRFNTSNIVNESGVMQADTAAAAGVSTINQGAGATYGGDKAIHAFGNSDSNVTGNSTNVKNLISNTGVVAATASGVGTSRLELSAVSFGSGNALFAFGTTASGVTNIKNLVSDAGVVASDSTGVGTANTSRYETSFGGVSAGTALIALGSAGNRNLVSNTGVVATDSTIGNASSRTQGCGCTFGEDQGILMTGSGNVSNIVSNTGVIADNVSYVGSLTISIAACGFGGDKGIAAFGNAIDGSSGERNTAKTNIVSNTGVVASTTDGASGVTGKQTEQASGFGN